MAYIIILNEFKSIGTHWIAFYVDGINVLYFDGFRVEHIPKTIKKFVKTKIKTVFIKYKHVNR